jgi:hypothetical protein
MNRRALVEHLLRRHGFILTRAVSGHDRFAALRNLERAEKRFLFSFLVSLLGGSYWLTMELWGLNVDDLLVLPIQRVASIALAMILTTASILAILGYLSIGLVIERAVEIKPRD